MSMSFVHDVGKFTDVLRDGDYNYDYNLSSLYVCVCIVGKVIQINRSDVFTYLYLTL